MEIDLSKAIKDKEAEIRRLKALRPRIEVLVVEAIKAESGQSRMSDKEWKALREQVEQEMVDLGIAGETNSYDKVTGGSHFSGYTKIPKQWSHARII